MRVVAALLVLAGCDRAELSTPEQAVGSAIPCAIRGASDFTVSCQIVRSVASGRTLLTLIAPDGGFRRIEVAADGSGIAAADGAQPARTRPDGAGGIEVAIAGDRYRLPAAT